MSLLRWSGNLMRPPGHLPLGDAFRHKWETLNQLELDYISKLVWEYSRTPEEELESFAGDRNFWNFMRSSLPV